MSFVAALKCFWKEATREMRRVRSLATAGVLAAAGIVIKAFALPLGQTLRISFNFLPTALSAYLYGPVVAGFAGMVIDVIGFLVNPTGPYFFGFTLNAFLSGFVYGCWLWRREVKLWRTFCACLCVNVLISLILNPLWLHMLYGEAWMALFLVRIPKNAILIPIETGLLYGLLRVTEAQKRKLASS